MTTDWDVTYFKNGVKLLGRVKASTREIAAVKIKNIHGQNIRVTFVKAHGEKFHILPDEKQA